MVHFPLLSRWGPFVSATHSICQCSSDLSCVNVALNLVPKSSSFSHTASKLTSAHKQDHVSPTLAQVVSTVISLQNVCKSWQLRLCHKTSKDQHKEKMQLLCLGGQWSQTDCKNEMLSCCTHLFGHRQTQHSSKPALKITISGAEKCCFSADVGAEMERDSCLYGFTWLDVDNIHRPLY